MQLLQEEQLAMERKFLYKGSCVPRSLSLKKKQKTPSSPAKKSLDEMPTLFKWNETVQLQALAKKYQFWSGLHKTWSEFKVKIYLIRI